MAKPIFVVEIPNAGQANIERSEEILKKKLPGYHVLALSSRGKEITHTVYYEKDFEKVNLDELKGLVVPVDAWIESNQQCPVNAGTYETITTTCTKQDTYFDGNCWMINPDRERPVLMWKSKSEVPPNGLK